MSCGSGCLEIFTPGEITIRLEVHRDGTADAVCPCCDGNGQHAALPGNNPASEDYPCRTCGGEGKLAALPGMAPAGGAPGEGRRRPAGAF